MGWHKITLTADYWLPDEESARATMYGATDPTECFGVDWDEDPVATLLDLEDVAWSVDDGCAAGAEEAEARVEMNKENEE